MYVTRTSSTTPRTQGDRGLPKLEVDHEYIRDCSSILFSAPRASRQHAPWTPELVARTQGEIDRFDFLGDYSFES